jgi:hypothetical protein
MGEGRRARSPMELCRMDPLLGARKGPRAIFLGGVAVFDVGNVRTCIFLYISICRNIDMYITYMPEAKQNGMQDSLGSR